MRKSFLPSLILLVLAVVLYLLPGTVLTDWRLSLYSHRRALSESVSDPAAATATEHTPRLSPEQRLAELQERLLQKDAKIASLQRRLQHISEAKEFLPTLRFLTANVIARPGGLRSDTLTLDRGRHDGIADGDAVVQGQALLGTVARVGPGAAQISLLTRPGHLVGARTGQTRDLCAVQGEGYGSAKVVFYNIDVKAKAGDVVVTSGLLGTVPADLLIGVLAAAPEDGAEPNTREAPLRMQADISIVEDLLVIHRLDPTPATDRLGEN